jgi:hypothetical protein
MTTEPSERMPLSIKNTLIARPNSSRRLDSFCAVTDESREWKNPKESEFLWPCAA